MDNVTHSLVGAVMGRAGLYRRSGLSAAALIIGANLPDIDVLAIPFGENLAFRRGITHGVLSMIVLPPLLTLALVGWHRLRRRFGKEGDRAVRPWQLLLLSYLAVLTHPFFDWLNTYGVRLLMPFSDRWFYGDTLFIIDLWIWIAFGLGVWLSRRREHHDAARATRPARVAIGGVVVYIAAMWAGSVWTRGAAIERATASTGVAPRDAMAGPVPINPFKRELIVDMGDRYLRGSIAWVPSSPLAFTRELPSNRDEPLVQVASRRDEFADFLYWSRYPYFEIHPGADSTEVRLSDVRFEGRSLVSDTYTRRVRVPN